MSQSSIALATVLNIAKEEWRYWHRSKLAAILIIVTTLLAIASVVVTQISIEHAAHERQELQHQSESAFVDQPDRHPHRMVHYGHYVFRTPTPLSVIDPGVDAYTGTAIFLEGHRQNTAMFSAQQQSSGLTRISNLTPAFVMQVLAPLLLILVGYSAISRERESGTIQFIVSQGTSSFTFLAGKLLALMSVGLLFSLPLAVAAFFGLWQGESVAIVLSFIAVHLLYLFVWSALILMVSALNKENSGSFVVLIAIWIAFCLIIPRLAASTAASVVPSPSKLEADFEVLKVLRKLGDGHNSADPAFMQLKANLLAQYDVDRVEDLPLNFKGVVAQKSEAELTDVLNQFAEKRMQEELEQAKIAREFGWLSPTIALRTASMTLAGSNLETHHRFLREAEKLRFEFVQSLNKMQAEQMTYLQDANKYQSAENLKNARISAKNWQVLEDFTFALEDTASRMSRFAAPLGQLIVWLALMFLMLNVSRRALS